MKQRAIAHLFFLLTIAFSSAQQIKFNSLSVNDGLSQHDVSSILQDSEGFIWIGTYDGLNRFDGYDVETFYHDNNQQNTLSSNRIQTLFEDNDKRIWIGTDGNGLNYYNLLDGTITRVKTPNNYNIINHIIKYGANELLVATNRGLLRIKDNANIKDSLSIEVLQSPLTGLNIKHIYVRKNNTILYATNDGLWLQEGNEFNWIKGSLNFSFNRIVETKDEEIWIGGLQGLYTLKDQTLIVKGNFSDTNVLSITEGLENNLWISTFKKGLYSYDRTKRQSIKIMASNQRNQDVLDNNALTVLYRDRTNTLWLSNKNGLFYSNLNSKNFYSLPIVKNSHIRTLFADKDHVYYGYQSDNFYRYSISTKENLKINLPNNAKAFRVDTLNAEIYFATTRGLYKQNKVNNKYFELVPIFSQERDQSTIYTSFTKDNYGNHYYGTFKGLIYKSKNFKGWIHDKYKRLSELSSVRIFTLWFDYTNECLWVGTISKGIFKINLDHFGAVLSVEKFNEQMSGDYNIPNNSIWSFYKTEQNDLYVGTDTGLLVKKENKNSFQSVIISGIENRKIMGIVEDSNNNLWLNNSQGIINYDPKERKTKIYNQNNGLLTTTFTEAIGKNTNGQLFFGNLSGINYVNSSKLEVNPFVSKAIFTNLLINNKKIEVKEEYKGSIPLSNRINIAEKLVLNHEQNNFSIGFSSSNYANVKVNKYRYKLEGYDDIWNIVDTDKRYASYSNIPDGKYQLIVEATNPNGEWSKYLKTLIIEVNPAPWNSWWAYLLYTAICLIVIISFIYFILNKQKLKNQIAISNLKNEKEKEINEMKLIFFTDVAHEFKTPLSLIIGPLNDLIRGVISAEHKEFCYNIISRNTQRMMNLVNQLLDFRKINSGLNILSVSRNDISFFIRDIAKSFDWQAKSANISYNIIAPESYFCHFDKSILEKVIYNLLSNAFKYTPNGGTIEIEAKPTWKKDFEYYVILIKDSGKGITQKDKKRIFERHYHGKDRSSSGIGLHLSAKLIEAHKGEINVLNSSFGGTEFMISLPVSSKAFLEEEFLFKKDIPKNIPLDYVPGDIVIEEMKKDNNDKEKILLVEDDFDLRNYLKKALTINYNILEADNGKTGLELALKEMPDIIITDVMMPEMDGIELCESLKKSKLSSHIPVLMLTAKAGDEFYRQGIKVGAWDYIAKPFDSAQLIGKINNILETRNNYRTHLISGSFQEVKEHYLSYDQQFVLNIKKNVKNHLSEVNYSIQDLSKDIGLSRMQLHRKLKSLTGLSTTAFINKIRIEEALYMFDNGCDRVQEAMDAVGISSNAHFIRLFRDQKGITPSQYIDKVKTTV